jgi:iron-sulfur cluster insertion protein
MGEVSMQLDQSAVEKLRELIAEEKNPDLKLRVFVQGGGCSGMQYGFTFDEEQNEDDFDFAFEEVRVVVDAMSMDYLRDANIRYEESVMGSSFVIDNPQAQTTCGCGSSFNPF